MSQKTKHLSLQGIEMNAKQCKCNANLETHLYTISWSICYLLRAHISSHTAKYMFIWQAVSFCLQSDGNPWSSYSVQMDWQHRSNCPSVRWHTGRKQSYTRLWIKMARTMMPAYKVTVFMDHFFLSAIPTLSSSESTRPSEKTWAYCCMCNSYGCQ